MPSPTERAQPRQPAMPRILVIDDLCGRRVSGGYNPDRSSLCGALLLRDVTGDDEPSLRIAAPVADAVFCRGQRPVCAGLGDTVENDLASVVAAVRAGWSGLPAGQPPWSLILLDLQFKTGRVAGADGMPEVRPADADPSRFFGLEILRAIRVQFPQVPVILRSGMDEEAVAQRYSRLGAMGFFDAAGDDDRPHERLARHLWRHGLLVDDTGANVGHSIGMLRALREARLAAATGGHVLIRGAAGTGKLSLARYLCRQTGPASLSQGPPASRPVVEVSGASIHPDRYEREIFGRAADSAAPGALGEPGLLERAAGGDLIVRGVAALAGPPARGLLRVLDDGEYRPVGGASTRPFGVRFVSTGGPDLDVHVRDGSFPRDLHRTLSVGGTVELPPLSERADDVPLLVSRLLDEERAAHPDIRVREVSAEALARLQKRNWPENIRGLRQAVIEAVRRHQDVPFLHPFHFEA